MNSMYKYLHENDSFNTKYKFKYSAVQTTWMSMHNVNIIELFTGI